jgi:hypothetical protein
MPLYGWDAQDKPQSKSVSSVTPVTPLGTNPNATVLVGKINEIIAKLNAVIDVINT